MRLLAFGAVVALAVALGIALAPYVLPVVGWTLVVVAGLAIVALVVGAAGNLLAWGAGRSLELGEGGSNQVWIQLVGWCAALLVFAAVAAIL